MTHDDDMREIEAALTEFAGNAIAMDTQWLPERDKLLALIRAKLPAPDAEHEAKVEAWLDRAHFVNGNYLVTGADIDDGVRLMRARPAATERDTAAGELLRAAKEIVADEDYAYPHTLAAAIEAAERAGVKP